MTRTSPWIGAAILAVLAVSAAPARASTWNHRWSYLHFPATHNDTAATYRGLTLDGTYRWRAFSYHWAHPGQPVARSRTVRLHGRYDWIDSLREEGTRYRHTSTLTNVRTGGKVSMILYETGRFGDGQYHWGSTLDNVVARSR